jgi:Tfp pilus assembly protein PilF
MGFKLKAIDKMRWIFVILISLVCLFIFSFFSPEIIQLQGQENPSHQYAALEIRQQPTEPSPGLENPGFLRQEKENKFLSKAYAHFIQGLIYDYAQKIDLAVKEYQEALEYDHQSAQIHSRLGEDYLRLNQKEKARSELNLAMQFDPGQVKARLLLGLLYLSEKKVELAEEQFAEVLKLDSENLKAMDFLADLYLSKNQAAKAL